VIPTLLWRCPLCATNDALLHITRRLRADRVECTQCGTAWRVSRVPGDSFYLELVQGAAGVGDKRSIAAWYDTMKETIRLEPIHDPAMSMEAGEVLYLASGAVELQAEETDPIFFPQQEGRPSAVDKREIGSAVVGRGRLFLTSRRLAWQGGDAAGEQRSQTKSFPLTQVNSAYAMMDYAVAFLIGTRLYTVHFLHESLLKWVTYVALVARQVLAETGHRITTSHF